ncbi:(Fe-S)-binding protein [Thermodesulfobacterium thermophilum]|uniref:(Fe-S)-binding protein n=1 Tax=Thermodesulfobacterium thermophilum TaxID=886 RepID=UPI0004029F91|nr:(Fe-S)-binding protein [Thermodesulfobacterium thermophilum]
MEGFVRKPVFDIGIDKTIERLDKQKIKRAIERVLNEEATVRFKIFLETCMRCGMCSESCHHYLSHDRDPSYAPASKVKLTLGDLIAKKGKIEKADLKRYARIAFTECNLCRRCTQFCPFGIDIAYLISLVRRLCGVLGVAPQFIQDQVYSHMSSYNMLWFKQDEWIDTIQWIEDELRYEIKNARIPLGKKDADILLLIHGLEAKYMTPLLSNMLKIMLASGVDFTLPDTDGWDYTNKSLYMHDFETMTLVTKRHYEIASKLRVKRILITECGHAYRAALYESARLLGWKEAPIPFIHAVEFFYEILVQGKIKIAHKVKEKATLQDPCNIVRYRGLGPKLRFIVRQLCEDFVEMTPNQEYNYCCSSGGGMVDAGPPWKGARIEGGKVKIEQIKETGASLVIAPCHTCHKGIEDLIEHYKVDAHVKFLADLIAEHMEIPERLRP